MAYNIYEDNLYVELVTLEQTKCVSKRLIQGVADFVIMQTQ